MKTKPPYSRVAIKRGHMRDRLGPIRCMAVVDGYVVARRKGAMPFVLTVKEWLSLNPYLP